MTNCDGMKCFLFEGCPGRTGACYACGPDDDGCPVYRWFKEKLLKEQSQWHPFNPLKPDDTGLKDHYFYLVTVKGFATPMKAKYHDDLPFGFSPPQTVDFDPCDVIAWRELPDNMDEEATELSS